MRRLIAATFTLTGFNLAPMQKIMKPVATIRTEPADFVVQEIPMYPPTGSGDHVFAWVRKTDWSTPSCMRRLAKCLGIHSSAMGHAGMKDRHAVTTQMLSFPWKQTSPLPSITDLSGDGIEVLSLTRHGHKLRVGHLIGNRFEIVLRGLGDPEFLAVKTQLESIAQTGIPNAFGPQRYGNSQNQRDNVAQVIDWMQGRTKPPYDKRVRSLLLSSVQSFLFDQLLAFRVEQRTWDSVVDGDLCKVADSGGLFLCTEASQEMHRAKTGQIVATGPIFGAKMRRPTGQPDIWEQQVLHDTLDDLVKADDAVLTRLLDKLGPGSRRALRVMPKDLLVERAERGSEQVMVVHMELPKGCYATSVLGSVVQLVDGSTSPIDKSEKQLETN